VLGTAGDIILADLSQYLLITKGGPQLASSIHVMFIYDETTFRIVFRCDGQPAWNSTLTMKDGTTTYRLSSLSQPVLRKGADIMSGFVVAEADMSYRVLPSGRQYRRYGGRIQHAGISHATIILTIGSSAVAVTKLLVKECLTKAGAGTLIAYDVYKGETTGAAANADVLASRSRRQPLLPRASDLAETNNIFYVVELEASQLSAGYEWVEVSVTADAGVNMMSCVAILSGPRYAGVASRTVLDTKLFCRE